MDLTVYVDRVRRELAVAAEAGGADAVALADRLTAPLTSALHLTLLQALSEAADEITRELAPGSVELRLRGGEPSFAVTPPPVEVPGRDPAPEMASEMAPHLASPTIDDPALDPEAATARINFRVPEALKARIEEAAAGQGRSVNAWLTRAAAAALRPGPAAVAAKAPGGRTKHQISGWFS